MRFLFALAGMICVALAVVGVFVPLLPTVPFLLLAAFLFARSSERLHGWLLSHPRFGPMIDDWMRHGTIRPRAKRLATLSIIAVFGLSVALGLRPLLLSIQGLVLAAVLIFIWTRPNA